jgi:voltage-gated potassium channel
MITKKRLFNILLTDEIDDPLETRFHAALIALIFLSVLSVALETEESLYSLYGPYFRGFEYFSISVFSIEYVLRLWVCNLDPRYNRPIWGRVKFALTPMALVDLVAILPGLLPTMGMDFRFIRAIRLTRLFRVLKLSHYSQSLKTLNRVIKSKKEELLVTLFSGVIILIISSSLMYYVERDAQPDAFNSIPAAMWWGVATLTTIGYGDIYPKTVLGKVLGSVIGILGIGLFALPAGIIASGFATELSSHKSGPVICPHCGQDVNKPPAETSTNEVESMVVLEEK